MGISIGNKYHSLSGSYSMMFQLRKVVANKFNTELGALYSQMPTISHNQEAQDKYWDSINRVIEQQIHDDADNDILDFLFMPDCDGKINYKTCKKIYELIKDETDFLLGYVALGQSFNDFKEILKECYSKRMNLRWY